MGQRTARTLELCGTIVHRLDEAERAEDTVRAAGVMAFEGQMPVAVLIAQAVIGAKGFGR
jgi:hypothetical protein